MDPKEAPFGTPRSGSGFVLAVALALFTFWGAGLVFQLHSFIVDSPIQHAAATPAPATCSTDSYDARSCGVATRP